MYKFPEFIPRVLCVHILASLRVQGVTVNLKIFWLHPNQLPNALARGPLLPLASV